jgi:hypothetical protein
MSGGFIFQVEIKELPNWEHTEILAKPDFFAYVAKVVTGL